MTRPAAAAIALLALTAASCQPPPPVPPPRFKPNPPYPPEIVEDPAPDDSQNRIDTPEPLRPGEYPVARPTANPNEVISPFPPYNLIDIEGFRTGQLARDPSNNRIFRVP